MERAKALKILGHEFHTIGKLVAESNPNAANTKKSIKVRAEVAVVMMTMAKVCTRMPFPDMSYYVICTQIINLNARTDGMRKWVPGGNKII